MVRLPTCNLKQQSVDASSVWQVSHGYFNSKATTEKTYRVKHSKTLEKHEDRIENNSRNHDIKRKKWTRKSRNLKKCSTYTLIYQKFIVKLFDVLRLGLEFKNWPLRINSISSTKRQKSVEWIKNDSAICCFQKKSLCIQMHNRLKIDKEKEKPIIF